MGRRFPVALSHQSSHPVIAWSVFIACIAATIAIFSPLCGLLFGKKSSPPQPPPPSQPTSVSKNDTKDETEDAVPPPDGGAPPTPGETLTAPPPAVSIDPEEKDYTNQPLPPPPAMVAAASNLSRSNSLALQSHAKLTSSRSKKILSSSMSMKGIGNAMSIRQLSRKDHDHNHDHKKEKKFKHQDSLLNKTIILGEKCKVPDDEDDAIFVDEKGRRIPTYHPRTSGSGPLSRQTSF